MTLRKSAPQTYHITTADPNHAMLTRYGILTPDDDLPLSDGEISQAGDIVTLAAGKREVQCRITPHTRGYRLELPLIPSERLFGLGDATRQEVMIRGLRADMDIANVTSYGPMPVLLSDCGWAIVV